MDNKTTEQVEEKTCQTPIEDQRKRALEHYKEASSAIHHWSGFVEAAIKAYNSSTSSPDGLRQIIEKRIKELNEADKAFCFDRWDNPLAHDFIKHVAREESNKVTFARQELQEVLKWLDESVKVDTVEGKAKTAIEIVQEVKAAYPYIVFPKDGKSQDCLSAEMARVTCDNIIEKLKAKVDTGSEGVEEKEYQRVIKSLYPKSKK